MFSITCTWNNGWISITYSLILYIIAASSISCTITCTKTRLCTFYWWHFTNPTLIRIYVPITNSFINIISYIVISWIYILNFITISDHLFLQLLEIISDLLDLIQYRAIPVLIGSLQFLNACLNSIHVALVLRSIPLILKVYNTLFQFLHFSGIGVFIFIVF